MNNSNDPNKPQDAWLKSAISELDDSVETMDAIDANRLRTVRQMAYREAQSRSNKGWGSSLGEWLNWKSSLTLVCTIALLATVTLNLNLTPDETKRVEIAKTTQPAKPKASIEVIPLLTAREELEFYESVNFLLWLENKQKKS